MFFWQQVAKFVFNVSNLLFQVSTLQTDADKQWLRGKATTPVGSPLCNPFLVLLLPSLGFDPYFGKHWARSINQPLCQAAATRRPVS